MNMLTWLDSLRPALPYSTEKPTTVVSNSELRRWILKGSILVNSERVTYDEPMDFPVFSLVFFPKSKDRKTTIV